MKKVFFLLLVTISTYAQEHNIWYFGTYAGLDFNSGVPVALTDGQLNTMEGSASIADSNGNLLFYTNGVSVWNKNHEIMENGTGLMGDSSSIQSALIVLKPGSNTIYYIFTVAAGGGIDGFRYSVVDIEADNGLGAIIEKNILLHTPTSEAISVTWHNNGEDIWVVSHNYGNNIFSAYLITADGVALNPVTSSTGFVVNGYGHSCMKISPKGNKLAFSLQHTSNNTQLFNFDNNTGVVSNPVTLLSGGGDYGLEFSPSGNVLYTTNLGSLYQYNLEADDISNSGIEIFYTSPDAFTGQVASLQIAPDNKVYVARHSTKRLSAINNPDVVGFGCDFEDYAIDLADFFEHRGCTLGLPNTVLTSVLKINIDAESVCIGEEATFSINLNSNQFENLLWDFGDGTTSNEYNPTHIYQDIGTYTVKVIVQNQGMTRVSENSIEVLPIPQITQPSDLILCDENNDENILFNLETQNSVIIGTQNPEDYSITYYTSLDEAESGTNNISTNFTNTSNPQTIYVRMENKSSGCYATTSFELIVKPKPPINMPDVYRFCKGGNILLTAPEGFETYVWSNGETSRIITVNQPGDYTITVTQITEGVVCENSKTITVYESEAPIITQIKSTEWTVDSNTITVSVLGIGNYEYSLDNIFYQDSPEFKGLESGIYTVYVRDKDGCGIDKSEVIVMTYPKFFTPNGDGINDIWNIKYSRYEPSMKVHIFDRYGKLITSFSGNNSGWDGRYNGRDLPATDYWFVVERQDGRQYKGHFSLIR
jgi:gliding motility-associated-like protein